MSIKILRRHTGAAGPPPSLLSGQLAINDVDGNLYVGIGDNGNSVATSIVTIAGAAFLLASKVNAASGVAPLDANKYVPIANLPPSILGAMTYQMTWNPNTNTPQLLSGQGTKGYIYKVSATAVAAATTLSSAAAGSAVVLNVASAAGIAVGNVVTGAGIAAGTTVTSISGTQITLSTAVQSRGIASGTAVTFTPKQSSGLIGQRNVYMGYKPFILKVSLNSFDPDVTRLAGVSDGNEVPFSIRGFLVGDGGKTHTAIFTCSGEVSDVEYDKWQAGKWTGMKFNVSCSAIGLTMDGTEVYDIDIRAMIDSWGGTDKAAARRTALGFSA